MTKEQIKAWYGNGVTDTQLDGTGAAEGSFYAASNYVSLGVLTQAEADAIRAGHSPEAPELAELRQAYDIVTGKEVQA